MTERRQSKKTFIRYAGKTVFIVQEFLVISFSLKILLGYLGPEYINAIMGSQAALMLTIYGMAGWSDHRKEKNTIPLLPNNGGDSPSPQ